MRISGENSDQAILVEVGARIRRVRLRRNVTQEELATEAGVSRPTVQGVEEGRPSRLVSVIRILRALGIADGFEQLVREPGPSPIEMLEMQGRERQRASGGGRSRE